MNAQKGSYLLKTPLTLDFTLNSQGNNTTSAFCPVIFYVPRPVPSIQLALLSTGESNEAGSCRIHFQELRNGWNDSAPTLLDTVFYLEVIRAL